MSLPLLPARRPIVAALLVMVALGVMGFVTAPRAQPQEDARGPRIVPLPAARPDERAVSLPTEQIEIADARRIERDARAPEGAESNTNRAHRSVPRASRQITSAFAWPVAGSISSPFGPRGRSFHHGLDIRCAMGEPIRAARAGRVLWAGKAKVYGLAVVIAHDRGISTLYGHLSELDVYGGQEVDGRAVIGHCGSTGRSTGPHLHLEFRRKGVHYDPIAYLR